MTRAAVRPDLLTGTVTFLFTDVEGSTRLLHDLGAERYADALAEHRSVIRAACVGEGGAEVDTQGDAFFFAFPTVPGAFAAATGFTEALASGPIQVRVGLHTGTPLLTDEGYVGDDVHSQRESPRPRTAAGRPLEGNRRPSRPGAQPSRRAPAQGHRRSSPAVPTRWRRRALDRELGDVPGAARATVILGLAHADCDDFRPHSIRACPRVAGGEDLDATKLLSCAEAVREEMGAGGMPYLVRNHEEALAIIRSRLNDDVFADTWQEGSKLTADEAVELALRP